MSSFETATEAQEFVRGMVDVFTVSRKETIREGLQFSASTLELGSGQFTNVYDISYREGLAVPSVHVHERLTSVYDFIRARRDSSIATGGGFFFLADKCSDRPRQSALNLAVANGHIRSLPVVDREAVVSDSSRIFARHVPALGVLSIGGHELSWSGSLTAHDTDVKVFGNGNSVITHEYSEATGSARVLSEWSRLTPPIQDDDTVDIGFIARGDGAFVATGGSREGNLNIFRHDIIVRCPERYLREGAEMRVRTVGSLAFDGSMKGALSVGPMLEVMDFDQHPINQDPSLGGKPPFLERPLARTVLYETEDEMVHIRLFDGRPGSDVFPGVTPSEAVKSVQSEGSVVWGCFLDPGQTAKLCIRQDEYVESLGNTHYLKWPSKPDEKYVWVPKIGRPTASAIALQ